MGQLQAVQHSHHRVPEGKKKQQEIGNPFLKIMKENLYNLVKEVDLQVQEAHRVSDKMDVKRPTPIHIIVKMPKVEDKERHLKTARENSYLQGSLIRL